MHKPPLPVSPKGPGGGQVQPFVMPPPGGGGPGGNGGPGSGDGGPTGSGGLHFEAVEGQNTGSLDVGVFSDLSNPGSASAVISWGDGSQSFGTLEGGGGLFSVYGSHVYTDEAIYDIQVTFSDDNGSITVGDSITVDDANLSATGVQASSLAGTEFTAQLANLSDANPLATVADFTASVNWGDQTAPSSATVTAVSGVSGLFRVFGTHTYAQAGQYTAVVTIDDDSGKSAQASSPVTVYASSGGGNLSGSINSAELTEGLQGNLTLAGFSDADGDVNPADYAASALLSGTASQLSTQVVAVNGQL